MNTLDFIGIGTSKAGTTTISKLLGEHPDICFSIPKELRYFNGCNSFWENNLINYRNSKGINWLFRHFKHCNDGKIKGEFSPRYFSDDDAPKNIQDAFPEAKLILCLRNPIKRLYSQYHFVTNFGNLKFSSFRNMLDTHPQIINQGNYYVHLLRWFKFFPPHQVHIIVFEEFVLSPAQEIKRLYKFLGVDPSFNPPSITKKFNISRKTRSHLLRRFEEFVLYFLPAIGLGQIINWLKSRKWMKYKRKFQSKEFSYTSMKVEDNKFLFEIFKDDIHKLEILLGRDFSCWLD